MKLLIADDHTLFRDALVQYIERAEEGAEVLLAKDYHEAMEVLAKDSAMDLVLLDLRMPGMRGLDGFKGVREKYPEVPLALMSGVAEPEDVQAAMELGAVGFFPKTLSGKALLKAIQLVLTGERFVPLDQDGMHIMPAYQQDEGMDPQMVSAPSTNNVYAGQPVASAHRIADVRLTPRETEVLSYLVTGASNKEIARILDLQIVTVKLHVRGICRKLDAKNRTQAALKAKELGISPAEHAGFA